MRIAPAARSPLGSASRLRGNAARERQTARRRGIDPDPQRALLIGNFLSSYGGSRAVCEDLADQLERVGWDVVRASSQRARARKLVDMVLTAWRQRHDYSVAQLDLYSGKAFVWGEAVCAMLRVLGRPYVLTLHGGGLPAFAGRRPDRVRRLLRSAAAVTAPSHFLRRELAPYRSCIKVIPNALELDRYPFRLRSAPAPKLVWVRSFHEMYNPVMAVEVAHLLRERFPSVHLTMVGPDRGDASLCRTRVRVADLGLADHIRIVPGVPKAEVPALLAEADIFLNTTSVDNSPVSVLEAMACGLCVVTTQVGGIPDLATHEVDALLVPCREARTMAEAVARLLLDPPLSERLSASARGTASRAGWEAVLPLWTALLTTIATSRDRTRRSQGGR